MTYPRGLAALVVALAGTLGAFGIGLQGAASAATEHRAGLIVDTGGGTHTVVVQFSEDSISGLELLQRAGADPVVRSYTGQGGAVCALYGVGHAADNDCLGSSDDPRYWAYFLAHGSASGWTYSRAAAGAVQVHDGDVDGWKYGSGSAPAFQSFVQLTGGTPATTGAPPATAAPSPPAVAPPSTTVVVGGVTATAPPPTSSRAPSTAGSVHGRVATSSSSTSAPSSAATVATGTATSAASSSSSAPARRVAARATGAHRVGHLGAGSPASLVFFGAVLACLAAAIVVVRRRRARRVL